MRRLLIFILLLFFKNVSATHNRAGEITYKQLSDLSFEITITTYTYTLADTDRDQLEVEWGDNTTSVANRVEELLLPDNYKRNKYKINHTFPGPGVYTILVQDPNRNYGVDNIPNSVNVVFSITTTIYVIPDLGTNTAPELLNAPTNKATKGKIFVHNPGAYDIDGDSISYELTVCTGEDGLPIAGYELPKASNKILVDSISGDFIWDAPVDTGKYNVAMLIIEWRHGVRIGQITRDMQIDVHLSDNNLPALQEMRDFCIGVYDTLDYEITATDADNDSIQMSANGGPFEYLGSPAQFNKISAEPGRTVSNFYWETRCQHIRKNFYDVVITAEDNNRDVRLADLDKFSIQVIGPAPTDLELTAASYYISLKWRTCECPVLRYDIYRRTGKFEDNLDSCTMGLPPETYYEKIGETLDTFYVDDNMGDGLFQGIEYCYRIVAVFEGEAYSYASEEVCSNVVEGSPNIINTSVDVTDDTNGKVTVRWFRPTEIDTAGTEYGPFQYHLYRSEGLWGKLLKFVDSTSVMTDTVFVDSIGLNTLSQGYSYKVVLQNNTPGNEFPFLHPQIASTIFIEPQGGDNHVRININKNTPWLNNEYTIYRLNEVSGEFDSIGVTKSDHYIDKGLENNREYCYKVKSEGNFKINDIDHFNVNFSQEACAVPIDTVPPCPPEISLYSSCDSMTNVITWSTGLDSCFDEIKTFKVYYAPDLESPFDSLVRIEDRSIRTYTHLMEGMAVRGCYYLTSTDSTGNESIPSKVACIDECTYYKLPNVFTPNGDNINDIYRAIDPTNSVKSVNMKIYSRNGSLVFETTNPKINWDGTVKDANKKVPTGVYYYVCDVFEDRIGSSEPRALVGFIHVYTEESNDGFNK